jgi:hypothetical protein
MVKILNPPVGAGRMTPSSPVEVYVNVAPEAVNWALPADAVTLGFASEPAAGPSDTDVLGGGGMTP